MQPPAPGTLRILHLSDTHVTGDGALHQGTVDTTAALGALLDHLDGLDGVGLVVVSGDVSEDGSPESYATVRDLVGGWAERHGAAFVTVPGNHDQRDGFRRVLFDGHVLGEGGRPLMHTMEHHDPAVPVRGRSVVAGRRIVTVDTSVPGAGYGELSATATEHLRAALAEPAPHGSVVVLHHPPLPAPTSLHDALKLRNPGDLAAVLRGADVRVVLAGHYHHHFAGSTGGVPVLVAPGVANDADVTGRYDEETALVGTGALVVDLAEDGSLWSTPVRVPRPDADQRALHLDADTAARIAAAFGPS
ncbi:MULTISPECIES: metallophosphoesterase [unclassified Curtobacterium]|uniref:metallophosphoesterase n=1 Tax=unclassified Curtobacterium TaxID=257496 RepID=UPI000D8B3BCA|nr:MULTISPECIES: metallophosphoesterase [unclassified Curtobacterium]PYY37400.1 metallophosphatase [Curtobacterium sp. MCPF17_046]WIB14786.1 metallophosphoesterase [Curtobacterium sp. MCPF17_050]